MTTRCEDPTPPVSCGPCQPRRFDERWEEDRTTGCHIWTGPRQHAYGQHRGKRSHRYAWEQAHGPIPAGLLVLHKCDTPLCVNVDHLFLGTQLDNMRDAIAKGRRAARPATPVGERRSTAKLTERAVGVIKARIANGESDAKIAADYPVLPPTIRLIRIGRNWAHVAPNKE